MAYPKLNIWNRARPYLLFLVLGFIIMGLMAGNISEKDRVHYLAKEKKDIPDEDSLAVNFKNPPAEYSIFPFWSWNNTLDTKKLNWQMDQMLDKGVYGAFMHARDGLDSSETPYFSNGWWTAVESTVKHAHGKGFFACLYDEDKWPSGSAGGRTIATNPNEYIKKGLKYKSIEVIGPQTIWLNFSENAMSVFAGKISSKGEYDFSSQENLTALVGKEWKVPPGRWVIIAFTIVQGPEKQIDYLDSAAVANFLHITHDEYFKRLAPYFGNTIPGVFFDEIYANLRDRQNNIFWTDDFLEQFKKLKGYDLNERLPLIIYNDPEYSSAIRYDFFDVVRTLYTKAWFTQYAQWAENHHIWVTGHTTEGLLHYTRQSDYFYTMGQLQIPCTDNEDFRYGYPRQIDWYAPKQMSSIGHIYGKERVAAEALGSGGYTIPLEEYRYGFAMLGVYGINMFVPHLFHYSMGRPENQADWPPSWFYQNPYWKYFKPLATYAQRISYMMSQGNHLCKVAIAYPLTQLWLSGYAPVDDSYYKEVQRQLLDHHIDYDVIDPFSLSNAVSDSNGLSLGNEHYKIIVLPDLKAVQSDVMERIKEFVAKGGIVIGLNGLPSASEKGTPTDPNIIKSITHLFGFESAGLKQDEYYTASKNGIDNYIVNTNNINGKGIFTRYVEELPTIINNQVTPDIKVEGKDKVWLKVQHREAYGKQIFFFVNGHKQSGSFRVSFQSSGEPYRWNAETGEIKKITNYRVREGRLELMLDFKPWEAYFIILEPGISSRNDVLLKSTDLEDFELSFRNDSLLLQGWSTGNGNHELKLWKGGNMIDRKWNGTASLPEIPLLGNWEFQLSPHRLDYQWNSTLQPDTVELPVMKFRAQSSPGYRNPEWNTIKVEDQFSKAKGCQRYLSSWDAEWISYYDYSSHLSPVGGGIKYFRKELNAGNDIREASLDITADKTYELFINGKLVGKDSNWKNVTHYDIRKFIVTGSNIILVKTTDTRGLLLQGEVRAKNGVTISFRSDDTWEASPDQVNWNKAFIYASPPLGPWGNIIRFHHQEHFPVTGWYQQSLPPGTERIIQPDIIGKYDVFVNERRVHFSNEKEADIRPLLMKGKNIMAIKVRINDYNEGLQAPVKLICGKASAALQSWTDMDLSWYSGRALYHHKVKIPEKYFDTDSKLMIDLGQVDYFAEIWINDKLVSYHPWPPFKADITPYVHSGENDITIVVANLLANQATWSIMDANIDNSAARWWHYGSIMREKEKLVSGLLGPVRIIPYTKNSLRLSIRDIK